MSGVNKTMNKATQGIFVIDGYEFSKDTTVEDVKTMGKYHVFGENSVNADSLPNTVEFCERTWVATMHFFNGKVCNIKLYPRTLKRDDYDSESAWSIANSALCEKVLDGYFENNIKKENVKKGIVYYFDGGIASVPNSFENGRDYELGGYIYVSYDG